MGYTTEFRGSFKVTPALEPRQRDYLAAFCSTRRMQRDAHATKLRSDPVRRAVNLPVGVEGEYYVGEEGFRGQGQGAGILDYNTPPVTQPGLWCQWAPTEDGTAIEWDGNGKFYHYVEWLEYIIDNFLDRWGYTVNGEVEWRGEEWSDTGVIVVENNEVIATER